ncbi:MAG: hypothetical protein Q8N68_01170, partial [bacterium]|nr:hypothetical protein [bacterium]
KLMAKSRKAGLHQRISTKLSRWWKKLERTAACWIKKSVGIGRANGGLWRKIRIKSPQRASEASAYLLPKTLNV